jgi:hypothetical protein
LPQFAERTNRAGNEIAAAIGADAAKYGIGAVAAEGAFETADPRHRVGWQIAVATFTIGPEFEHPRGSKRVNGA